MENDIKEVEKMLEEAMPWIGLYIVAASTICTLAMAADVFNGFRLKKLWFPCKFFSLNAASLTVLGVAMKLSVDLNTNLITSDTDFFAKYTSLIFMVTTLINFMSSLGSITDKEVLANVVALGIFVITVSNNVGVQLIELHQYLGDAIVISIMFLTIFMLILLATVVSLAITVPNTKRILERKYQEKHIALRRREASGIDDRRGYMMKYMVMAETSSPQFVMARSAVCSSLAAMFLWAAITFAGVYVILGYYGKNGPGKSPYGNYTMWIAYVQSIGVAVGTIGPAFRWFVAISFKCATSNRNGFKMDIKIEDYWTQTLVDWRDSASGLEIQQNKCRKYLHDVKWFTLTFFIAIQILVVLISKQILFHSALLMSPFFKCFTRINKFVKQTGHESGVDKNRDLNSYILLLEGEAELPRRVLKNICRQADQLIQKGRKKQPQSLFNLLHKFANFNGVGQFDSIQIQSLHSQEPPNCWTLPVVTLTSIAIALPNIAKHQGKLLLSSVSEGLSLAKIVEETLVKNAELVNIRKAADIYWVGVVLYMKWLETYLREMSRDSKNSKGVVAKALQRS